jgi:hypothetical protein
VVDLSEVVRLYVEEGLSLRAVGARAGGLAARSVSYRLERAGVARRPNGTAHRWPRVEIRCDSCGQPFSRREYYHAVGNGTRSNPNPPEERFCSANCFRWGLRRIAEERARNTMVIEVSYQ